jgi:NAD(P)-dependent dehydrogenase (short-subunit alcohol dehydrogenase family)
MQRIGRPGDIANAVIFFASEQARCITGQVLFVHGQAREKRDFETTSMHPTS